MPTNKPKRTEKAKEDKTKKTASASKTTKISKTSKTSKTIKATETTKNERQKTESRRGFKHKILDDNEMEAEKLAAGMSRRQANVPHQL